MKPPILAVHAGGIGDLILCAPALECLAREGTLTLAGQPGRAGLLQFAGIAAEARGLDAIAFHSLFTTPAPRLREFAKNFQRAVVWMRDPDRKIESGLRQCGIPRVECHPGLPPPDWTGHASAYYRQCAGAQGPAPARLDIPPAPDDPGIIIHPGSGGPHKNWPPECFAETARLLESRGRAVTWCIGPAEPDFPLPQGARVIAPKSLIELAQRLAAASAYLGNDSGVTHLAAAAGAPVTAIFGPTPPEIWAPLGPNVRILQGDPWPSPAEALGALLAP